MVTASTVSCVGVWLAQLGSDDVIVARPDLAGDKVIKFGIESKVSCPETSTDVFRQNVVEAMREMRAMCEQGQLPQADTQVGGVQAKL